MNKMIYKIKLLLYDLISQSVNNFTFFLWYKIIKFHILYESKFDKNKKSLLALDYVRFRSDLNYLKSNNNFNVLTIKQSMQRIIFHRLISKDLDIKDMLYPNSKIKKKNKIIFDFLSKFCVRLKKELNIKLITAVNFRYLPDYYWVNCFKNLGVDDLVIYREGFIHNNMLEQIVLRRLNNIGDQYWGKHLAFTNELTKNIFLKNNFGNVNNYHICGQMRYDDLYNYAILQKNKSLNRNILFCYFDTNKSAFGFNEKIFNDSKYSEYNKIWQGSALFNKELIESIKEFLKNYTSNSKLIIRPKIDEINSKEYINFIEKINYKKYIRSNRLEINHKTNTIKLLNNCKIVIAFDSTVVIEALILRKKIIIPIFNSFQDSIYYKEFAWKNYNHIIDFAYNKEELINKCNYYLNNENNINEDQYDKIINLFEKFFYKFDNMHTKRFENLISKLIND